MNQKRFLAEECLSSSHLAAAMALALPRLAFGLASHGLVEAFEALVSAILTSSVRATSAWTHHSGVAGVQSRLAIHCASSSFLPTRAFVVMACAVRDWLPCVR